jgi:acyl carrier protein
MATVDDIKRILADVLQLQDKGESLTPNSQLLGGIAEFDSMAVVSVMTGIEDHYGIIIDDDEVTAEDFESIQSLCDFVDRKLAE